MAVEDQRIDVPCPVHTPMRCPYLARAPDTSQITVEAALAVSEEVAGEAESVVAHRTIQEAQHVAGKPLDALDHIASRSSSAGLVAPAAAEEMAALRYSLSLYPCEYM
jgi:hypothetical protein